MKKREISTTSRPGKVILLPKESDSQISWRVALPPQVSAFAWHPTVAMGVWISRILQIAVEGSVFYSLHQEQWWKGILGLSELTQGSNQSQVITHDAIRDQIFMAAIGANSVSELLRRRGMKSETSRMWRDDVKGWALCRAGRQEAEIIIRGPLSWLCFLPSPTSYWIQSSRYWLWFWNCEGE